jgi:hypothetical protein
LQAWISSLVEIPHDFFILFPRYVKPVKGPKKL